MLGRRNFGFCALCAAGGVLTAEVGARAQAPGFTRTIVSKLDGPGEAMVTVEVAVDIEPGGLIARHTHPGSETGYLIEGTGTLGVAGAADRAVKAGDGWQIGHSVPHLLQNGNARARILAVYVVEKDKPLSTPAP